MKYEFMPPAEVEADDPAQMAQAIDVLLREGIDVRRPPRSRHHLKVSSSTNYYPTTGRIVIDGEGPALPSKGLSALLTHLKDSGELGRS